MNQGASGVQPKHEVRDCLRVTEDRLGEKSRDGAEAVYYMNPAEETEEDTAQRHAELARLARLKKLNPALFKRQNLNQSLDNIHERILKPRGKVYVQVVEQKPRIANKSKETIKKEREDIEIGLRFDQYQYEKERNLERLRAEIQFQETSSIVKPSKYTPKNRKPLYRDPVEIQLEKSQKYTSKHSAQEGLTFAPSLDKSKKAVQLNVTGLSTESPKKATVHNPNSKARGTSKSRSGSRKQTKRSTSKKRKAPKESPQKQPPAKNSKPFPVSPPTQKSYPVLAQEPVQKATTLTTKQPHYSRPTKDSEKRSEIARKERSLSNERRSRTHDRTEAREFVDTRELFLRQKETNVQRVGKKVAQLIYRDQYPGGV